MAAEQNFRKMRRFKQQVSEEACRKILREEWRGVLSVHGENGYPYGMPLDFYYDEAENKIYFHGAKSGHKIDAIKADDHVSFCVWNEGFRKDGDWAFNITSVILFGRISLVDDMEKAVAKARLLGRKYYPNADDVEEEIRKDGRAMQVLELSIDHMTGKLVNEK